MSGTSTANVVLLINGPAGVGKTTCARLLFERLGSCALLDMDWLTTVDPFEWGDELSLLGIRNAAALIASFNDSGFRQVILAGGGFRQNLLDRLVTLLTPGTTLFYFWLDAERAVRQERCLRRARDESDTARWFDYRDQLMSYPGPLTVPGDRYFEIDTTDLSHEGVVRAILGTFDSGALILRDP
jgi:hypothetical protein